SLLKKESPWAPLPRSSAVFRGFRIRTKLLMIILPLVLLSLGTSAYVNNRFQEEEMFQQAQSSPQTYAEIIRESLVTMMLTRQQVDDGYLVQLNQLRDIRNLHIHFFTDSLHLRELYRKEDRLERLRRREASVPPLQAHERTTFETGEPM